MRALCLLVLAAAASAQDDFIEQVRRRALKYNETLPNFVCTQMTRRMADYTGDGQWEPVDIIEQQLTYFDRREIYTLLAVNAKPAGPRNKLKRGVTSNGEFGSMLNQVFDPSMGAQFVWQRWDVLRARPVAVYSFRVDESRSRATIGVANHIITAGYHGLFFADRESRTVLRLVVEADAPPKFPMQDISHVLDYGLIPIAGEEFTLPLHSEMRARIERSRMPNAGRRVAARYILTRNEVDFVQYRKYSAQTDLKFESEDPKPKPQR